MNCPYCGEDTKVVDCRRNGETVVRRRKCLVCGKTFKTKEVTITNKEYWEVTKEYLGELRQLKGR